MQHFRCYIVCTTNNVIKPFICKQVETLETVIESQSYLNKQLADYGLKGSEHAWFHEIWQAKIYGLKLWVFILRREQEILIQQLTTLRWEYINDKKKNANTTSSKRSVQSILQKPSPLSPHTKLHTHKHMREREREREREDQSLSKYCTRSGLT